MPGLYEHVGIDVLEDRAADAVHSGPHLDHIVAEPCTPEVLCELG